MYFAKNIKHLREISSLTQIDLAKVIGKKKGIIGAYENERSNPDIPSLLSLCRYFDTDTTTILYTDMSLGEGGAGAGVQLLGGAIDGVGADVLDRVPFYGLTVSAGTMGLAAGAFWEHEQPVGWVSVPEFRGCLAAFRVVGMSMEPEILNGDIVFIREAENRAYFATQSIYMLVTHEERMLKRLRLHPDNGELLICSSPNYADFVLPVGELLGVYKVAGSMRVL